MANDSELGVHLLTLVPTVRFVDAQEIGTSVRQLDFDVAVVVGDSPSLEAHLFVIQFGGKVGDSLVDGIHKGNMRRDAVTVSQEFAIPDGLPSSLARLVRSELAPAVLEQDPVEVVRYRWTGSSGLGDDRPTTESVVTPFLLDADGSVVAGRHARSGSSAEWWVLPRLTPHPERWVAAALELWHEIAPARFPAQTVWQARDEWLSHRERALLTRRQQIEAERESAERQFSQALAALEVERIEAMQAADEGERRLLTAQGADLVDAVITFLEDIGFQVVDADEEISGAGDHREDLRVSDDSSASDWVALAEVRGYGRGAQLNDLLRLYRFVRRFVADEGREPSATWYVVNQFREQDPSSRPVPLESNPSEVQTFGEDGGVIIDTIDLFRLGQQVQRGDIDKGTARQIIRSARGRLPDVGRGVS